MDEQSIRAAATFTEIIGRNTYEWATTKLKQARNSKNLEEQSEMYDEIVQTLLNEKSDLQNVVRQYKDLYEQVQISPDDIQLLKETVRRVIDLTRDNLNDEQEESLNKFIDLINNDTLQTMQLLGFNYKEAIGQPLTDACAAFIRNKFE
ncbi:hypothetical protein [Marinococcus luteus]|uniref:hypothetical protein n=1 Tax=Marinococcus luteus TaxID=1122204 RepID=UPI002ACCD3AC|nr:hypothetical protein [Marinococcus luteus]MDZ5784609.1 hypothetical protein [Marinococcus luteus]